jgi:hypothetical protein
LRYLQRAMNRPARRLPPRRSDALRLHVRDLNLQPIRRYIDIQRERGKLLTIGNVDVDIEQVIERTFLCDRHRCIQWRPHDKKSESPEPLIDNSCCARYEIPVTDWDRKKLAEVLPLVRKRLDKDHPLVVDKSEPPYEIDEEFAFLMKSNPNGACQFVVYDQGLTACAIHKTCLEEGLDPWYYKPVGCSLWPAALVDYQDDDEKDRYLLTCYVDATKGIFIESKEAESDEGRFACLVDQDESYEPAYKSLEGILTFLLGDAFYKKLDQAAQKHLKSRARM